MKRKHILLAALALTLLTLCSIYILLFSEGANSHRIAELARARIRVGMLRSEAITLLSKDAWQHCSSGAATPDDILRGLSENTTDRFYYGGRNLRLAANVTIQSTLTDGELYVNRVWSDDSDQLEAVYKLFCGKSK